MSANLSFVISAIDSFSKTFDQLDSKIKKSYDTAGMMGAGMATMGAATAAGLGFAVNTAAEFEAAMDKVGALSGATGSQFDQLRDKALDLGASTSKSASEVAVAMQDLAAKGFDVNSVMSAMPGIIAASEASGEDLALTSSVVASALNAWHMEASQASEVADVLAMAANVSAASVDDMGYAFKYAAPVANTLGISMEEVAAATGIMTNAGLEGSQAGTSLRMALLRLVDAPKEAQKAMDGMGFSALDANGNMKSMSQIVGDLNGSMEGMTQAQKATTLATMFGAEAVTGMLAVLDGGQANFDQFVAKLEGSAGSAKATADIMRDNLKGSIDEMTGAVETAQISIGTSLIPAIQWLSEKITGLVNWFNSLSPSMQRFIAIGAAVGAGLLLLGGFVMIVVSLIPGFVSGFGLLAKALTMTSGTLAVTIGWIFLIIAAIVAIGVALWKAYENVGWFRDMVNNAWASIKEYWNTAINWIKDVTNKIMSAVADFIGDQLTIIRKWWDENGKAIMESAKFAFNLIWSIIKIAMAGIAFVIGAVWDQIVATTKIIWGLLRLLIETGLHLILGIISTFAKLLTGDWEGALETVKQTAQNIWDSIVKIFESIDLNQIGKDVIQGFIDGVSGMFGKVKDAIGAIADAVPDKIKQVLGIHSPSRVAKELGGYTGEGMAIGITDTVGMIQKAAGLVAEAAVPNIKQAAAPAFNVVSRTFGEDVTDATSGQQKSNGSTQQNAEYFFEIPVIVDGRQVAKATAKFTQVELDRMKSDKERASGNRK